MTMKSLLLLWAAYLLLRNLPVSALTTRNLNSHGYRRTAPFPSVSCQLRKFPKISEGRSELPRLSTHQPILDVTEATIEDSTEQFANDVHKVVNDLRGMEFDPEIPASFRVERRLSLTYAWTLEDWKRHHTRKRFFRCIYGLRRSVLLRQIAPQFSVLMVWNIVEAFMISPKGILGTAFVPVATLSLVSTFVAALLTLRSNQSLSRLGIGREAWGNVMLHTRSLAHLISSKIMPKDRQLGLHLARHVAIYPWLMKAHLRNTEKDVDDVVRTMLPSTIDADYIMSQRKLPAGVLAKLRQGVYYLSEHELITHADELCLEHSIEQLDKAFMVSEQLRNSPVPPLYTTHTCRLLTFYLGFLPLSFRETGLTRFATITITAAVGFAMLGLDEIAQLFEQPFQVMPLFDLSKLAMEDVVDGMVCTPPPLPAERKLET